MKIHTILGYLKGIFKQKEENLEDIVCPVCGYYCLGQGGHGCIHKNEMCKEHKK